MTNYNLEKLFNDLSKKKTGDKNISYTSSLLSQKNFLAKKINEESTEVILEFLNNKKNNVIKESADLIYHVLVVWVSLGIVPDEIWNELSSRKIKSGIEEKKNRGVK